MRKRILVVDDDRDICEILSFNLGHEGYEVDTVFSAEEALKKLSPEHALILLDVMMSGMSGYQMAENLNYAAEGSKCYSNSEANCEKYGMLYEWEISVCPEGWHLPSQAEWNVLGDDAKKLKATSFGGTDDYGFSGLGSGHSDPGGSRFYNVGYSSTYWSADEYNGDYAYRRMIDNNSEAARWGNDLPKSFLVSVRCLQD